MAQNNSDSYQEQIDAANAENTEKLNEREKRIFYKQYKKFFSDTTKNLEDLILESWENNEYNKTMTNAIEHMANDIDRLTTKILPYFERAEQNEAASASVIATNSMSEAVVEAIQEMPVMTAAALMKSNANLYADSGVDAENVVAQEIDYRADTMNIFRRIDSNIEYIADYYRLLARNKQGKVGDPTPEGNKPKEESFGLTDLIAGFFSLKLLKKMLKGIFGKVSTKISGFFGKFFKGVAGFVAAGFSTLMKKFPILERIFSPISKMLAPILKIFGKGGVKAIPVIGQVVAVALSLFDFFEGFSDEGAAKLLGKNVKDLDVYDKIKSGIVSVIDGLLLGFVDKKNILGFINKFNNTVKSLWGGFLKMVPDFLKKNIFGNITNSLRGAKDAIFSKVSEIFQKLPQFLTDMLTFGDFNVVDEAKNFGVLIFEKVKAIIASIIEYLVPAPIRETVKSIFSSTSDASANIETIPKQLDASTGKSTTDLQIEKNKAAEKQAPAPNVIVPVPAAKPQASVERAVSNGRDDINRSIASSKQFTFAV